MIIILFALLISNFGIGILKASSANTVNSYVFLRILWDSMMVLGFSLNKSLIVLKRRNDLFIFQIKLSNLKQPC
jgi:hypothetical protein